MLKRYICSILTILITFITLVAISGYKIRDEVTMVISSNKPVNQYVNDNPGYIFDDYNKAVNLKLKDIKK